MSWLKHQRDYALMFGGPVPDLVCVHDLPVRMPLVQQKKVLDQLIWIKYQELELEYRI